jgi:hypothetical protein
VGIEPTHKGFADLSLTTWVPRLNLTSITKLRDPGQRARTSFYRMNDVWILGVEWALHHCVLLHFLAGSSICASRRNRADSSGGVGLM